MLNNCIRKLAGILVILLTAIALSSCVSNKKAVDPYPDRSYTSSVAQVRPVNNAKDPGAAPPPEKQTDLRPAAVQEPVLSSEISSNTMLPLLTLVDDRIVAYEGKVEQWEKFAAETAALNLDEDQQNKMTTCQYQLVAILAGYNELHQRLISESNGHAADISFSNGFLAIERQDLSFLESDCQQVMMADFQAGGWVAGTRDKLLEDKEREINEHMASGDYQQVIDLYAQLPLEEGQKASYTISYNYGQALLKTGRENDAAVVFQDLLVDLHGQNHMEREFKLMQLIADVQFGLENYDRAFERYIDIINRYAGLGENIDWARKQQSVISSRTSQGIEVRNYSELMRSYLTYNAERDGFRVYLLASRFLEDFPNSSVIPTVNHILFESMDRAEAWFAFVLQKIGTLKDQKKYEEALQVIDQLPQHEIPMDKRELLNSLADEMVSASFEKQESMRLEEEEAMLEIWNSGQNYLREKEYDQAIEVFSTLLDTSYTERAGDKIVEASQLAAQEDRREAAELFVQASQTDDRDNRIDLLFQSRQLLKGILTKYPRSGLVEKAEKNLERIEEEIRSMDPALLVEPTIIGENQETFQQPKETTVNGTSLRDWEEKIETEFPQE